MTEWNPMSQSYGPLTIDAFLLARYAEDEAVARAATDGAWAYLDDFEMHGMGNIMATTVADVQHQVAHDNDREAGYGACESEDAAHIVRWQPARVLAECEAKRRIVEEAVRDLAQEWHTGYTCGAENGYDEILSLLALPYSDHPDYSEEWRI